MKKYLSILLILVLSLNLIGFASNASDPDSDVKNVIKEFYDRSYESWLNVEYQDLSDILYVESIQSYNKITAFKECILRWQYSIENGYIDTRNRNDIYYDFDRIIYNTDGTITVNVNISGDATEAYPYFVNFGENIYTLVHDNGKWKIASHIADGIQISEYPNTKKIAYNPKEVIKELKEEGKNAVIQETLESSGDAIRGYPYTSYSYSPSRAVAYANKYCKTGNNYFYAAGQDCTNFVSQCVSYGFGSTTSYTSSTSYRMYNNNNATTGWFADSGGGSAPWESVTAHWNYMLSNKTNTDGPRAKLISYSTITEGAVMQIDFEKDGTYDHSVICVDASSKKFAQHSLNVFRYYSDYGGNKRFYLPTSYRAY